MSCFWLIISCSSITPCFSLHTSLSFISSSSSSSTALLLQPNTNIPPPCLPPCVLFYMEACFSSLPPHPLAHPSEFYVGCITFRSFIINLLLLVFSDKTGDGHKIMGGRANEDPMILCPSPVFPLVPISLLCSFNLGQKHGFFTFRAAVFFIIPTEHHPRLSASPWRGNMST